MIRITVTQKCSSLFYPWFENSLGCCFEYFQRETLNSYLVSWQFAIVILLLCKKIALLTLCRGCRGHREEGKHGALGSACCSWLGREQAISRELYNAQPTRQLNSLAYSPSHASLSFSAAYSFMRTVQGKMTTAFRIHGYCVPHNFAMQMLARARARRFKV